MPEPQPNNEPATPPKQASFLQVVSAVFWSFFGVRKRAAMSRDVGNIKPQHVIAVGIVMAAIFVLTLIAVVRFITRSSGGG